MLCYTTRYAYRHMLLTDGEIPAAPTHSFLAPQLGSDLQTGLLDTGSHRTRLALSFARSYSLRHRFLVISYLLYFSLLHLSSPGAIFFWKKGACHAKNGDKSPCFSLFGMVE